MPFRIGCVILVGQVFELDGAIDGQRAFGGSLEVAAGLFVTAVSFAARALHFGQHTRGDFHVASCPSGFFHGYQV